jgi:hypothetical protein
VGRLEGGKVNFGEILNTLFWLAVPIGSAAAIVRTLVEACCDD